MFVGLADRHQVVVKTLFLSSESLPKPIVIDATQTPDQLAKLKKEPSASDRTYISAQV